MLPDKKSLRVIPEKAPTKQVFSYSKKSSEVKYVVVATIESCNRKRLLCLWWYDISSSALAYVSYISKKADILTRSVTKPIRWYQSNIKNLPFVNLRMGKLNFDFVTIMPVYTFFNESKSKSAVDVIYNHISKTKLELKFKNSVINAKNKCIKSQAFFDNLSSIPKGVKQWAISSLIGYEAYFNIDDRFSAHCSKCGKDFSTSTPIKSKSNIYCPHCKAKLQAVTRKRRSNEIVKGFQVLSRLNSNVVVRHFTVTRKLCGDTPAYSFYEYERNLLTPGDNYDYLYYIKRYSSLADNYYWDNKKLYKGPHLWGTLKDSYYDDEPVYFGNISSVLKDTVYEHSCLELHDRNYKTRAEDYLSGYYHNPFFEQLFKAGYKTLAEDCLSHKLKTVKENYSDISDILGNMPKPWLNYVKDKNLSCRYVNLLKMFYDTGLTIEDFDIAYYYLSFENLKNILELYVTYEQEIKVTFRKIFNYLKKGKYDIPIYKDYLRLYGDIINHRWNRAAVFPKNLLSAHDRAAKLFREKEDKLLEKKLLNIYNSCFKQLDHSVIGDYQFIFPKTKQDFINEGNNNKNCVGSYASLTAKRDGIVVVFMRLDACPDKSLVTLEYIIKNGEISLYQCYRRKNTKATKEEYKIAHMFAPSILKHYKFAS